MVLLKAAPVPQGGGSSRDFVLGEASDGVLVVDDPPAVVAIGLYIEVLYTAREAGEFVLELMARAVATEQTWYVGQRTVSVPPVERDPDWKHPFNIALPFRIEFTVDDNDLDVYLVACVDGEPSAIKTLFLRPAVPEPDQAGDQRAG